MRSNHARLFLAVAVFFAGRCLADDTFDVHEFSWMAGVEYANPYLETSLVCAFTGPSSSEQVVLRVPGFWDGGDTWRCRVAPTVPGEWTYETASPDPGLDGLSGAFTVSDGVSPGFIQRRGGHDWQRSTGEPLFLMGDTCWRCLNTLRYSDADFSAYIAARSGQRFNLIRGYVMSQFRSTGDDTNDGGTAYSSPDIPDPLYWREVDRRIAEANAAGITWSLVVGGDGSATYEAYFNTHARRERYLSMLIARYAAYNIIWDGVAEGQEHADYQNLISSLGRYLEAHDPYDHPRGQHPAEPPGDSKDWLGESWLEYISYQGNVSNRQLIDDRVFELPLVHEEYCYEFACYKEQSSSHNCSSEQTREKTWRVAMAGAYPVGGHVGSYTGGSRPFAACSLADEGIDDFRHLYDLFTTLPLDEMTPDNALTDHDGFVYRKPDEIYVIYQDEDFVLDFTVDLSEAAGTFEVRWLNPRTGAWEQDAPVVGGSSQVIFSRPDSEDWALVLSRPEAFPPSLESRRGRLNVRRARPDSRPAPRR